MPGSPSDPELLTLHAVRLLGFAPGTRVAERFGLDAEDVGEVLLDLEASGLVRRTAFADTSGWSLTERGRAEDGRRLADELAATGARAVVEGAHAAFVPVNARLLLAVTRWQVRPSPGEPLAVNDHTDHRWDDRVIEALASVGRRLVPVEATLAAALTRFEGYAGRYTTALDHVLRGQDAWVDGVGVDSCHTVWMQLHEDLLATLGLERGEGR